MQGPEGIIKEALRENSEKRPIGGDLMAATKPGDFPEEQAAHPMEAKTPVNTGDNGFPESPSFGQLQTTQLRKSNKTGVLYRFLLRAGFSSAMPTDNSAGQQGRERPKKLLRRFAPHIRNTAGLYGQSCAPWKIRVISTASSVTT